MSDTIQTVSELLTALADNTSGAITPQTLRQLLLSLTQMLGPNLTLTPKLSTALARIKSGNGSGKLLMVGDSTLLGYGSNATTNQMRYNGICDRLADLFNGVGIAAESNGWIGNGYISGVAQSNDTFDSRITVGSGWSKTGTPFPGGATFGATSTTSALAFEPLNPVDTFVVYYYNSASAGSFTYNLNGGSNTTVTFSGGASIQTVTVSGTLGSNTLNLNWASGTVNILGVDAYNSGYGRLSILNAGWGGSKSSDWVSVATAGSVANTLALGQDATVLCLGINDANNSVSVSTFTSNMQTLITALLTAGDVILLTCTPSNPSGYASTTVQGQFQDAIRGLAASNGLAVVDLYSLFVSYAFSNALGIYYDSLHPNGTGYAKQAQALFNAVAQSGASGRAGNLSIDGTLSSGQLRALGQITPASGSGLEAFYNVATGYGAVVAYNRSSSTFLPLRLNGSTLSLNTDSNGTIQTGTGTFAIGGLVTAKTIQFTNQSAPASGSGVEVFYSSSPAFGAIVAYNRTGAAFLELRFSGSPLKLNVDSGGPIIATTLPSSDPHVAGQFWSNGGVVTQSAG